MGFRATFDDMVSPLEGGIKRMLGEIIGFFIKKQIKKPRLCSGSCGSSRRWSADMLESSKWHSRVIIHARARVKMMNIQILWK